MLQQFLKSQLVHEFFESEHVNAFGKNMTTELTESVNVQHTATHCDTLQHAATHCDTLQHAATISQKSSN